MVIVVMRNSAKFCRRSIFLDYVYLALRNIEAKWKNPMIAWHQAKAQFAIQFEERFTLTD